MTNYFRAACWATLMIAFALLARFGLADRNAVITMLTIMPLLAFVSLRRGRGCCGAARDA